MKNNERMLSASVFFLAFFSASLLFVHRLDTGGDNLDFLLLARSIQNGCWEDALGWPRPPGYSILIVILYKLIGVHFGESLFSVSSLGIYAVKIFGIFLFSVTAVVVYKWATYITKNRLISYSVALLFGSSQILAVQATVIGAEMLLLLTIYSALQVWEKNGNDREPSIREYLLFVLVTIASMFIKYQGLMLASGFFLWVFYKRKWKRSYLITVMVIGIFYGISLFLLWYGNRFCLTHVVADDPYGYGHQVTWATRIKSALETYSLSWPGLIIPKIYGERGILALIHVNFLWVPLSIITLIIIGLGLLASVKEGIRLSHLYALCFYGMLFMWPDFLSRYLMPLLPIGLWFFIKGLCYIGGKVMKNGNYRDRLVAVVTALIVLWNISVNSYAGVKNWRNIFHYRNEPPWSPGRYQISREESFVEYIEACCWIRDNTSSNVVTYGRKALFVELVTERPAKYYTTHISCNDLWKDLCQQSRDSTCYILYDNFTDDSTYGKDRIMLLDPLIESYATNFVPVFETDAGTTIYRFKNSNSY